MDIAKCLDDEWIEFQGIIEKTLKIAHMGTAKTQVMMTKLGRYVFLAGCNTECQKCSTTYVDQLDHGNFGQIPMPALI